MQRKIQHLPESNHSLPVNEKDKTALFLAEVTDDLDPQRNQVKAALEQRKIEFFPKETYPRDPAAFRKALERDLQKCRFFVQLLGPLSGKKIPRQPSRL